MSENNNAHLEPVYIINSSKQLMESSEVKEIALKVMADNTLEFQPAEIGYFLVYPNLSKQKIARVIKSSLEVKFYSGNDYLIEISGEVWDMFDSKTREMVLLHELLCIEPVFRSKTQEWKMKLRKPDFSDFYAINDKYGNEWYKTVQATASSLYDLDPRQESSVTL